MEKFGFYINWLSIFSVNPLKLNDDNNHIATDIANITVTTLIKNPLGVTAYGFLVFCALYTPCIAALATMRKEYGNKMMFISLIYQFTLALHQLKKQVYKQEM